MTKLSKWDLRFLHIAYEVSSWSKDVGTRVGSVLVQDRRIIATGFNGFPVSISDDLSRYENRELKLAYTVHAEVNAILNAAKNGAQTDNSTLYVTFSPCVRCATSVIQAGVKRVVCPTVESAPERWRKDFELGHDIMTEAGILIQTFVPSP